MLYKNNNNSVLDDTLFKSPTSEYRGAPFWAWNSDLKEEMLLKQIDYFKEMGMGGFHIHSRSGLKTEYLGNEYLNLVKICNEKAKENKMLCWLYDEDRWPSGFGGGIVTKDDAYKIRFLVLSRRPIDDLNYTENSLVSTAKADRSTNRKFLAKYEVKLEDGYLTDYRRIDENDNCAEGYTVYYAYMEISSCTPWYNNSTYVNTLDKKSVEKFIEVTHEKYFKELGDDFGTSIPAIFTDEPQFSHKQNLDTPYSDKDAIFPYTDDFKDTFLTMYNYDIIDYLPEIIYDMPNRKPSKHRYNFHEHITYRFVDAYVNTIGKWCKDHNIKFTGHMMGESSLKSQNKSVGDVMRAYPAFDIPGVDLLNDSRELHTLKQAQSVVHQEGSEAMLSELYGVTNWDFDFRGHKLQGDWQAALGVNVRVHHHTWLAMEGESKRDYPACIGYQSPWFKEYKLIEDHFSRLNTALTRGKPIVKIGVIHPIESYWLNFGCESQTGQIRDEIEKNLLNICSSLLYNQLDFNFICEGLLPSQSSVEERNLLSVGCMNYEVIVIPGCETIRKTTLERLKAFKKGGGKVIFLNEAPRCVDAQLSNECIEFSKECVVIPFYTSRIIDELKSFKDISIVTEDGVNHGNLIYAYREENYARWLFVSHVQKMKKDNISLAENVTITINGAYKPKIYNTLTGEITDLDYSIQNDKTIINRILYPHDSLLLQLIPSNNRNKELSNINVTNNEEGEAKYLNSEVNVTLEEPNVLLLDIAKYSFNFSEFSEEFEEVLKIDDKCRKLVGYPLRFTSLPQPWCVVEDDEKEKNILKLKYEILSETYVDNIHLALENIDNTEIEFNGEIIDKKILGFYVDETFKKIKLPKLQKGINTLILTIQFSKTTNVEAAYLLGDFAVKVSGRNAIVISPVRKLSFGDYTHQGLPFYGGNLTYHCEIEAKENNITLNIPNFKNPLLKVDIDGQTAGYIAFSPYKLNINNLIKGKKYTINITAFGNRHNTFAPLHNTDGITKPFKPVAWRTTDISWSYEYNFKPIGILSTPTVL